MPTVGLFATCLIDALRPDIGFDVVRLLEHAGYAVNTPLTQTCCGQPAYNSGDREAALRLARKWVDEFEGFDYVVAASGSCTGMVKAHYAELFKDDPDLLRRWSELSPRIYELCDFLVAVARLASVPGRFQGSITYHDSCSGLRELGVKQQPRQLLALMPGVELREMKHCEQCCGFGGTFSIKYGEISGAIVDEKCHNILDTGADAVVLGDLGCMLNIEGRLRRLQAEPGNGDKPAVRVLHIAQVLGGESTTASKSPSTSQSTGQPISQAQPNQMEPQ